jgi:purine-binding chemotaxis protein CheW
VSEQLCTFWLNNIYFGINVQHVQEVIRSQGITRVPLAPPDVCGLINLRGQIITVIDLQKRLDIGTQEILSDSLLKHESGFNIVVYFDNEVVSLLVDDVGDVLEFSENTFQLPPATLKGRMRQVLAGAYPLTEGFLLVVDIEKILNIK